MRRRQRVVVVGVGFGGLALARALKDDRVDVTVLDRTNHHLFQPLLYQVATAGLAPTDVAYPARGALRGARGHGGVTFHTAEVVGVDWEAREVVCADGRRVAFDHLVLAAGARTASHGLPLQHAEPLKSVEDALHLRTRLLTAFERADADPDRLARGELNVVIVGGGPTGVELAGAVSELYRHVLARDFPNLDVQHARVALVELADHVLDGFDPRLRRDAERALRDRGVELHLGRRVADLTAQAVRLDDGTAIPVGTAVWAAGVEPVELPAALGLPLDDGGRVAVVGDLSVPGHPEVWAIGDLAAARGPDGRLLPQLAPVALQGGRHVARQIRRVLDGQPTEPFRYRDKGIMATIGRGAAVAQLPGGIHLRGTIGWLAWLWLHLVTLIGFRNRVSVLVDWAWSYLTWDRGGRILIRAVGAGDLQDADGAGDAGPD